MKVRFSLQAMFLAIVLLSGIGWGQDAQSVEEKAPDLLS